MFILTLLQHYDANMLPVCHSESREELEELKIQLEKTFALQNTDVKQDPQNNIFEIYSPKELFIPKGLYDHLTHPDINWSWDEIRDSMINIDEVKDLQTFKQLA